MKSENGKIKFEFISKTPQMPDGESEYTYLVHVCSNSGKWYESLGNYCANARNAEEAKQAIKQRIVDVGHIDNLLDDVIPQKKYTENGEISYEPLFTVHSNLHPIFSGILNAMKSY